MDLATKAGNNIVRTLTVFIIGSLAASLIYTTGYHYTTGQSQCETAETLLEAGDYYPNTTIPYPEEACASIPTRWQTGMTSPLDNLFFWPASFVGGVLITAMYLAFFLNTGRQRQQQQDQDFENTDWEGRINQGQNQQGRRRQGSQSSQNQPQQNGQYGNQQNNNQQNRPWNQDDR